MRKCLFCENPANSREHVLPQWVHRCISSETGGIFPVQVGLYIDGQGNLDEKKFISLSFKAKIVCVECNIKWMSEMESKIAAILKPLTEKQFPTLVNSHLDLLRSNASALAHWLSKTALTTSYALPGRTRLPDWFAETIRKGKPPLGIWMDVAKAKVSGIGAVLSQSFPTVNGNRFVGMQRRIDGACFQFCIQINHLLLRIAMTPDAEAIYHAPNKRIPIRLFPDAVSKIPENIEFNDIK